MDKATLKITKSKSGAFVTEALFIDTGKKMTIQNFSHKDIESLNGKEVDTERDNGQIIKMLLKGEIIYSNCKKHGVQQLRACAPYNFIPLNDTALKAEELCSFDTYRKGRFTGYIDLCIKTKTPLYIRNTLTENRIRGKKEKDREQNIYITADKIRIPGSSIRGMTRTMVEIVSFGKFGFFDDKRLYFRAVADTSSLGEDSRYPDGVPSYKKTIGEHIPQSLKDETKIDLADAIFGNERTFAGRVFFEDAFCNQSDIDYEGEKVITLLEPKPTLFQHYLEQNKNNFNDPHKKFVLYNSDNNIRGNKLYWHKSGRNWANKNQASFNEDTDNKINPVKADIIFTGKIRFENLSAVELGALLFAIDLPEGCCHKLGMGKPLGLGSVAITSNLFISDRTNRYTNLFAEWEIPIAETDKSEYKKAFEHYVLEALKDSHQNLWDNQRMRELKTMLDFSQKPLDKKTRYMTIGPNEFKNRRVLSKPSEIVKE